MLLDPLPHQVCGHMSIFFFVLPADCDKFRDLLFSSRRRFFSPPLWSFPFYAPIYIGIDNCQSPGIRVIVISVRGRCLSYSTRLPVIGYRSLASRGRTGHISGNPPAIRVLGYSSSVVLLSQTNSTGGSGISCPTGRHRCRQYGWMFT